MRLSRGLGSVATALLAAIGLGCGLGPGEGSEGEATLRVTRDYGSELLANASESDPDGSETVIRFLDREAEITTRYGGGFVQSIDGLEAKVADGRSLDWFFFVNGIESDLGAAEVEVGAGDRIWWDYRDWTAAMRAPAVVGSWPEPFAQASVDGDRRAVEIECHAARPVCDAVAERLAEAQVEAEVERPGEADAEAAMRMLVGCWERIRGDAAAAALEREPATSGVFARFGGSPENPSLTALDQRAGVVATYERGAGLVAALRRGNRPPSWVVTGTDGAGVKRAIGLLDAVDLADRYAVMTAPGVKAGLPAPEGG